MVKVVKCQKVFSFLLIQQQNLLKFGALSQIQNWKVEGSFNKLSVEFTIK